MKKLLLGILYPLVMRNFLSLIVGVKYHRREVLNIHKQFIIVANHNSHLDTMALMSSLDRAQVARTHPVAAGDYFGQSPFKAFCTRFFTNAILIPRKLVKGGHNPIFMMSAVLKQGDSLIVFPEGSRGEPEKMQAFKKGVGLLLKMHPEVPYIPVFMKGMGKILPKGENLLVPFESYVCFGEPAFCTSTDADGIARELEEKIRWLRDNCFVKLPGDKE